MLGKPALSDRQYPRDQQVRRATATLIISALSITAGFTSGCGKSSTASVPAAPSDLTYPQSTIAATVGQAISPDVPSVSGSVTSFSVSPSLPAGLTLNSENGAISGMPTTALSQSPYIVSAQGPGGSTTTSLQISVQIAAPSNLVYPQSTIAATIGQAITPDVPTISGTVSSYSISPALPLGLSLDSASGTISGTPTALFQLAKFTVTAQNSTGQTTAVIQVAVHVAAPANLTYSSPIIEAIAGREIIPDIPLPTGIVTSYSVTPALPAGLRLDATSGILSGTSTGTAPQANYVVSATNDGGSTTASVRIAVTAQKALLELGHSDEIMTMKIAGDRVLSADFGGHWALWSYSTGALIANGDGNAWAGLGTTEIDLEGSTVVVAVPDGLEIRASSDGHLQAVVAVPGLIWGVNSPWWKLASDGSYVCVGTETGLSVLAPSGNPVFSKPGNYSSARAFGAPGQVQIAMGAAGADVIETISVPGSTSTVSAPFSGSFNTWFLDGGNFLTNEGNTVWVYSSSGAQQSIVSLPDASGLTGQGNWIWTYSSNVLNIYAIGETNPAFTLNASVGASAFGSGSTIGVLPTGPGQADVIDLSGTTPTQKTYSIPIAYLSAFAANSASEWLVANKHGAIIDGTSTLTKARYFGHGSAWAIAGASGTVAFSTSIGEILIYDPSTSSLLNTIEFPSGKLVLSNDGTVLGASAFANDAQFEPDRTLNFYSLPSGTVLKTYPYTLETGQTALFDFTLAGGSMVIGQVTGFDDSTTGWIYHRTVTSLDGTSVIWSDSPTLIVQEPVFLSQDGSLIAATENAISPTTDMVNIYKNGILQTAVPGLGIGWIDNDRLLVNNYTTQTTLTAYSGCAIFNSSGVRLATPPLPELHSIQTVSSDSVYDSASNAIYSLTTGQTIWKGTYASSGVGAVAGPYVVYQSDHTVVIESH